MKNKTEQEPYTKIYRDKKTILLNNFLGGIAWGVGTVIGATIIVGLIGMFLSRAEEIPFVGDIIENVMQQIQDSEYFDLN